MRKRLWSILLALCMMLSLLPVGAMAAKVVDSGKCGDNLTWTLTEDGVLTIRGTGAMTDFDEIGPWYDNSDIIEKVIIESGVTTIGSFAFDGCTNIKSITIPKTIVSIGELAFLACFSLKSIEIPNSVTKIGDNAFLSCDSLTSINVDTNNKSYKSIDGVLFSKDGKKLTRYPGAKAGQYQIPDGVTSVGTEAFQHCMNLTELGIPGSVTEIGDDAFSSCEHLSHVTILNGLSVIPYGAFEYCDELTTITIPSSVQKIGAFAFYGSDALVDVYYDSSKRQWEKIEIGSYNEPLVEQAVIHCSGLELYFTDEPSHLQGVSEFKTTGGIGNNNALVGGYLRFDEVVSKKDVPSKITWNVSDPTVAKIESVDYVDGVLSGTSDFYFNISVTGLKAGTVTITGKLQDKLTATSGEIKFSESGKPKRPWNEKSDPWSIVNHAGKDKTDFRSPNDVGFYITGKDYDRLVSQLHPVDYYSVASNKKPKDENHVEDYYIPRFNVEGTLKNEDDCEKWHGSCHGLSVTSLLVFYDALPLSVFDTKASTLHGVKNNAHIRSAVNFYHQQQHMLVWQNLKEAFLSTPQTKQLQAIEKLLSENSAIVIGYGGVSLTGPDEYDGWGHCVVAYGIESQPGGYQIEFDNQIDNSIHYKETFDKRIVIYDCSSPDNHDGDIYYRIKSDGSSVWCTKGGLRSETNRISVNEENGSIGDYGKLQYVTADLGILNAVDYENGQLSAKAREAKLGSARIYALSDDTYSITANGKTATVKGVTYSQDIQGMTMAFDDTAPGSESSVIGVTVFLPDSSSYKIASEKALNYSFGDYDKVVRASAASSGDIVFKPTCETSVSTDKKTEIVLTAYNNVSTGAWDSFTVTADNADDLTIVPNDIVVTVSGDLENAQIEIEKDGKTATRRINSKEDTVDFTLLEGVVIPIDPNPTNSPAPSAQPSAQPTTAPSVQPTVQPSAKPSPEPSAKPVSTKFVDVADDVYYADAVRWAVEHNPQITNGVDSTHFAPNRDCTRAQMVTFLWRAAGEPKPESTRNPFTDVKKGAYYYDAVLWAVEQGITTGTGKTTFSPDAVVTRAQTVTFLWRMEGEPAVKTKNPFTDVKSGQYYTDAILWAAKNHITTGITATTFGPGNPCTRAQIVTFLWRAMA